MLFRENAFEKVVCKRSAFLFRPQWVKPVNMTSQNNPLYTGCVICLLFRFSLTHGACRMATLTRKAVFLKAFSALHGQFNFVSYDFMIQQETLRKRNGRWTTDYKGQWWDEFTINNVETTYVFIEILSMFHTGGVPHFKEVEFYTGKSMSCMLILLTNLSSTEYKIVSIFKQIYCFPRHTYITKHHQAPSSIPTIIISSSSSSSTVVVVIIVIVVVAIYIIIQQQQRHHHHRRCRHRHYQRNHYYHFHLLMMITGFLCLLIKICYRIWYNLNIYKNR